MVDKTGIKSYNENMTDKDKLAKDKKDVKEGIQTPERIYFSHNNLFTYFLEEKSVVESFLTSYVPAEIVKDLDFSTLKVDKESFVDKRLRRHFADILYHIRYRDDPAYVYVLLEHKSRERKKKKKLAPFQCLKYLVHIWDRHLKRHKKAEKLPPIIPIVIYHGEEEWEVSTDFLSLFDVPKCMETYIPKFRFELYDVSHMPDEQIKGNVLLRVLFLTFKYIFKPGLLHKLRDIFSLIMELKDRSRGLEYLEVLLRYFANNAEHVPVEKLRETADEFFEEGGDIMPTIVQQIKNEYKDEITQTRRELAEARGELTKSRDREAQSREEIARKMMQKGLTVDMIVDITGISRKKLEKIASTTH